MSINERTMTSIERNNENDIIVDHNDVVRNNINRQVVSEERQGIRVEIQFLQQIKRDKCWEIVMVRLALLFLTAKTNPSVPLVLKDFTSDRWAGRLIKRLIELSAPTSVLLLVIRTFPCGVKFRKLSTGYSMLHFACDKQCSFEIIKELIDIYPKAVQEPTIETREYPLHMACDPNGNKQSPPASMSILELLIHIYPPALHAICADPYLQDKNGDKPKIPFEYLLSLKDEILHLCSDSIDLLLRKTYPMQQPLSGKIGIKKALHKITPWKRRNKIEMTVSENDVSSSSIIHRAIYGGAPPRTIHRLMELFPIQVRTRDHLGRLPLHCALFVGHNKNMGHNNKQNLLEVAQSILKIYPSMAEQHDFNLLCPFHYCALTVCSTKNKLRGMDTTPDEQAQIELKEVELLYLLLRIHPSVLLSASAESNSYSQTNDSHGQYETPVMPLKQRLHRILTLGQNTRSSSKAQVRSSKFSIFKKRNT